jgi:chromosome segregation ATPase
MSDKDQNGLDAIRPAHDEVSSYRRSNRAEAPKQSRFNGILVFVIFALAIMMGVGGYVLFEVQKKLDVSNKLLANEQENVQALDSRLVTTGTDLSKSLKIMQSQLNTNVSEIDKLWAVAHRQNKPNIQKNEVAIKKVDKELRAKVDPLAKVIKNISAEFKKLVVDVTRIRKDLAADNQEATTQVSIVRGQVQDQSVQVEGNKREIAALSKQMKDAQEAIDVIDQYRKQVNQRLQNLQGQIQDQASPGASQTSSP